VEARSERASLTSILSPGSWKDLSVGHQNADRTGTRVPHAAVLEYPFNVDFSAGACNWDHAQFAKCLQLSQTGMY
jgi:hypothetical protein